jgi:cytochrome c biogenesis protein CcmG, thiol:disulfide interchange protein DsbE
MKAERRVVQVSRPPTRAVPQQTILFGTAALLVVIGIVVGILVATRSTPSPPPAAAASAVDSQAPASLVKAADAVGFQPNTEPGVGQLENQPASAGRPAANPDLLPVGSAAPSFTLRTPQGLGVSLSSFRDKAVLLEFFTTWCPHCAAEAPHLQRLFSSLPKALYAGLSINADGEDAASVFAYHRYFGLTFPALLDPSSHPGSFHQPGAAGSVTAGYHVRAFPTFYALDANGQITWRSDGEQPDALLRRELERAAGA